MKKPEALLAQRISNFMQINYPQIPFHFDTGADVRATMGVAMKLKKLRGERWGKGFPDLLIFAPKGKLLLMELKATKTVNNSEHTRRQRAYHQALNELGYDANFYCGYDECVEKIRDKLRKVK